MIEGGRQVLDHLPVERERGITVKAQTASMIYQHGGHRYLLNLIDTPVRRTVCGIAQAVEVTKTLA